MGSRKKKTPPKERQGNEEDNDLAEELSVEADDATLTAAVFVGSWLTLELIREE